VDDWTRLALAARDGDEPSLPALVRTTQPHVWRLCAHLGDRDAADDLTQETYLRAFQALPSYRGDSPVRVWLFTIAAASSPTTSRPASDGATTRSTRTGATPWPTTPAPWRPTS
jgi:hypothetical protein